MTFPALDGPPLLSVRHQLSAFDVVSGHGTYQAGPFYVGDWQSVACFFDFTGLHGVRIALTWTDVIGTTQTPAIVVSRRSFDINPSKITVNPQVFFIVENAASFLTLFVLTDDGDVFLTTMELSGTNRDPFCAPGRPVTQNTVQQSPYLLSVQGVGVGPSANTVKNLNYWYFGPAYVFALGSSLGATGDILLRSEFFDGSSSETADMYWRADISTYDTPREVYIPPLVNTVVAVNTDMAATGSFFCVIQPRWSGRI